MRPLRGNYCKLRNCIGQMLMDDDEGDAIIIANGIFIDLQDESKEARYSYRRVRRGRGGHLC